MESSRSVSRSSGVVRGQPFVLCVYEKNIYVFLVRTFKFYYISKFQ